MKATRAQLALLVFLSAFFQGPAFREPANSCLDAGNARFAAVQYSQCGLLDPGSNYSNLHERVQLNQSYALAFTHEAYQQIKSGKLADAEKHLRQALVFDPDLIAAHCNLGFVLNKTGRAAQALPHLIFAYQRAPFEGAVIQCLAAACQLTGDLAKASELYLHYLRWHPQAQDYLFIANLQKHIELELKSNNKIATAGIPASSWAKRKLKVFIQNDKKISNFDNSYISAMKASFQEWQRAGLFAFSYVNDESSADICCYWTDKTENLSAQAEAGETLLSRTAGSISKAKITILTRRAGAAPLSQQELKSLCMHEVGHALGLQKHSPCAADVMYFTVSASASPSDRDFSELKKLYGNKLISLAH